MVFKKGHPTRGGAPQPDWITIETTRRKITHCKCEEEGCGYERLLDTAQHGDIPQRFVRESAIPHAKTKGHNLIITVTTIVRYHGREHAEAKKRASKKRR